MILFQSIFLTNYQTNLTMKKSFLAILLCLISINLEGQISNITDYLNNYKRPDFNRKSLELTPSFGYNVTKDGSTGNIDSGLRFGWVKNSQKWQSSSYIGFNPSISFSSNEKKNDQVYIESNFGTVSNYYFNKNAYLLGAISMNLSTDLYNQQSGSNLSISSTNLIGIGLGRTEYIGDAIHVLRIVNELRKNGILTKEPTEDQLKSLTDLVVTLKNQRFFDLRLLRISEIEQVLQKLEDEGLINDMDYRGFAIFTDAYLFEDQYSNFYSGKRLLLFFGRDFNYHSDSGWLSADDFSVGLLYFISKMKNSHIRTSYGVNTKLAYRKADLLTTNQNRYIFYVFINYNIDYIPSSRIIFSLNNSANYNYDIRKRGSNDIINKSISFSSIANASYYISPRIRVSGSARLTIGDLGIDDLGGPDNRFSLSGGMVYKLQ